MSLPETISALVHTATANDLIQQAHAFRAPGIDATKFAEMLRNDPLVALRQFAEAFKDGTANILSEYLDPDQAAEQLEVCRRTLDRWHAARIGPPRTMLGRRPVYRREAIAQWLRKREEDPTQEKRPGPRARRR